MASQDDLPSDATVLTALALSGIGGLYLAKVVVEQAFVRGLSDEERKGVMLAVVSGACMWAAKEFFDADKLIEEFESHIGAR